MEHQNPNNVAGLGPTPQTATPKTDGPLTNHDRHSRTEPQTGCGGCVQAHTSYPAENDAKANSQALLVTKQDDGTRNTNHQNTTTPSDRPAHGNERTPWHGGPPWYT